MKQAIWFILTVIGLFCLFFLGWDGIVSAESSAPSTTTVTYTPSTTHIANPERGFYHTFSVKSSAPFVMSQSSIENNRTNESITLMYCNFVLDTFTSSDISATYLTTIQDNLDVVRAAGAKCVLRFSYTTTFTGPPYGDASKAWVLTHISQLTPILQANKDIIAIWQSGFIGTWGEWYYTDHFVDDPSNPGNISAAQYAHRYDMVQAQLTALPDRFLAIRTPFYKQNMLNDTTPIAAANAFDGSNKSRMAHMNDCFLANATDSGTYSDVVNEYVYLSAETIYAPNGGETCYSTPSVWRTDCATAQTELAMFHWSYINIEWYGPALQRWRDDGCMSDIERNMGYRLELQQGTYQDTVRPGSGLSVQLDLKNVGYAAPYNPRDVELVMANSFSTFTVALPDDPRLWLADGSTYALDYTVALPPCVPAGSYALSLRLPDPEPLLASRGDYAIRVANSNVAWSATDGRNDLAHTVTVDASAATTPLNGALSFGSSSCTPLSVGLVSAEISTSSAPQWLIVTTALALITLGLYRKSRTDDAMA